MSKKKPQYYISHNATKLNKQELLWSAPSWAVWWVPCYRCPSPFPHEGVPPPQTFGLYRPWWLCLCSDGPPSSVSPTRENKSNTSWGHCWERTWKWCSYTHRFIKLFACLCSIHFAWEGDCGHGGVQGMDDAVIYGTHYLQHLLRNTQVSTVTWSDIYKRHQRVKMKESTETVWVSKVSECLSSCLGKERSSDRRSLELTLLFLIVIGILNLIQVTNICIQRDFQACIHVLELNHTDFCTAISTHKGNHSTAWSPLRFLSIWKNHHLICLTWVHLFDSLALGPIQ